MEYIVSKVQDKVEDAMDKLEDVQENVNERLYFQLSFLQYVDWATFDYRNVYWPTVVDWEDIGNTFENAAEATNEIAEDLWDEVDDEFQYIAEEYLTLWWTELSQTQEFQNLLTWGVEVGPDAVLSAKSWACMFVWSALSDPNISSVI